MLEVYEVSYSRQEQQWSGLPASTITVTRTLTVIARSTRKARKSASQYLKKIGLKGCKIEKAERLDGAVIGQ